MNESIPSLFITLHSALRTSLGEWQNSAGDLSEAVGPALFGLAALVSAWVFHDARRRAGFGARAVWAWALLTLLFPPAVLPLYLAARLFTRRAGAETSPSIESAEGLEAIAGGELKAANSPANEGGADAERENEGAADSGSDEGETFERDESAQASRATAKLGPTLLYASVLVLAGGLYFYADYRSFDAHLARAVRAKLRQRPEAAIGEYRAALRVREDGHTRKLLGLELLQAGRAEEALAELRAAGRGGDTDDALALYVAAALDVLGRRTEAADAYRQFLQTRRCAQPVADSHCDAAGARLRALEAPAR
jgi:tetratricopeptide (TPR) repeat protein